MACYFSQTSSAMDTSIDQLVVVSKLTVDFESIDSIVKIVVVFRSLSTI